MRGGTFHNYLVHEIKTILVVLGFQVETEYRIQKNGSTTYFDLLAVKRHILLGLEIETSIRHVIDNAVKAYAVNIPVWFILPTQKLRKQSQIKLKPFDLKPAGQDIQLLLPNQLSQALKCYLAQTIVANRYKNRQIDNSKSLLKG